MSRYHPDPEYLKPVPNLDGLEGHSEYLIFGTNLDLSKTEKKVETHTEEDKGAQDGGEEEEAEGGEGEGEDDVKPKAEEEEGERDGGEKDEQNRLVEGDRSPAKL